MHLGFLLGFQASLFRSEMAWALHWKSVDDNFHPYLASRLRGVSWRKSEPTHVSTSGTTCWTRASRLCAGSHPRRSQTKPGSLLPPYERSVRYEWPHSFRLGQWKYLQPWPIWKTVDLFLLYLMWVFASLAISNSRYGQVVTQKPSAPAEFMSRFQRTVHSLSSMERCMKAWTWWPTLLKWLIFGWLA